MEDKQNFNIGNVEDRYKNVEDRYNYVIENFDKLTKGKAEKIVVGSYDNGRYELVAYILNPKKRYNQHEQIDAFLVSGIHGDEDTAIEGLDKTLSSLLNINYSFLREDFGRIVVVPVVSGSALDNGTRNNGYGVDTNRTFWINPEYKPEEVGLVEKLVNKLYDPTKLSLFMDFHSDISREGSYILANTNPKSYELAEHGISALKNIGIPIFHEDLREETNDGVVVLRNNGGVFHKDDEYAYRGAFGPPPSARANNGKYSPVNLTLEVNSKDPQLAHDGYGVASNAVFLNYRNIILANK